MARVRSPNRDKAFEIYRESNGTITNREIGNILDISEKTISGWKAKDKWSEKLNGVLQKEIRSTPKKKNTEKKLKTSKEAKYNMTKESYPLQARPGNKNAVTTGEFESIFFDTLEEEELKLAKSITFEKKRLLEQEIQLLTIRERRMLKRIESLKLEKMTLVSVKSGIEKGQDTDLKEYEGVLGQIQNIEEALTRVQDKKQKAIDSLHKFEIDEQRLELSVMKLELEIMKQGGQDEEVEDDGFMDALKSEVGDTWDD